MKSTKQTAERKKQVRRLKRYIKTTDNSSPYYLSNTMTTYVQNFQLEISTYQYRFDRNRNV
jgi:hypothetical protein